MKKRFEAKKLYYGYFCNNKQYWGNGFTAKRLDKIKGLLFMDKEFWDDILIRHGGIDFTPEELKEHNQHTYDHCMGNMTGMLTELFVVHKIIRP